MVLDKIEEITGVNSLELAQPTELTFWNGRKSKPLIDTKSRFILVREQDVATVSDSFIFVENPRLEFIKYAWEYHPPQHEPGYVFVDGYLYKGQGCRIGYSGFGYERDLDGTPIRFPHYGDVMIGSDVEIGSNTCIDRGTFGYTIIGKGTKIDNLVHIAHNVHIGENCIIVAGTVIGGGVIVGDNVWLGIGSKIREGITIGDGALVGMGAVVVKDVEPHTTVIGNPARVMER